MGDRAGPASSSDNGPSLTTSVRPEDAFVEEALGGEEPLNNNMVKGNDTTPIISVENIEANLNDEIDTASVVSESCYGL